MIELEFHGADELTAALLGMINPTAMLGLMTAVGETARTYIRKYPDKTGGMPSRASVYGQTFETDRQRRFFFWALDNGAIDVPYRRGQSPTSERLGQSWALDVSHLGNEYVARIGTPVSYARLMQDDEMQTAYARAVGWVTVQTTLTQRSGELEQAMEMGLEQMAQAAGLT